MLPLRFLLSSAVQVFLHNVFIQLVKNAMGEGSAIVCPEDLFKKLLFFIEVSDKHLYSLIAITLRKTISKPYAQGA